MKLVDDIFALYRDKLTADEEDLDMVTFAILENYTHQDLLHLVKQMNEDELKYFIRLYVFESLKGKLAQIDDTQQSSNYKNLH